MVLLCFSGEGMLFQRSAVFACAALFGVGCVPWVSQGACTLRGSKSGTAVQQYVRPRSVCCCGQSSLLAACRSGTFVGEGMNTPCPTGLATKNEAPVGIVLGGLGGVSNAIAI